MMMILYAMVLNLKVSFSLLAVVMFLGSVVTFFMKHDISAVKEFPTIRTMNAKFICLLGVFAALAGTPSPDEMFRLRVSLVKFEMVSPDNLSKGVEVIERIGKKLECKYLGCEEKDKK